MVGQVVTQRPNSCLELQTDPAWTTSFQKWYRCSFLLTVHSQWCGQCRTQGCGALRGPHLLSCVSLIFLHLGTYTHTHAHMHLNHIWILGILRTQLLNEKWPGARVRHRCSEQKFSLFFCLALFLAMARDYYPYLCFQELTPKRLGTRLGTRS